MKTMPSQFHAAMSEGGGVGGFDAAREYPGQSVVNVPSFPSTVADAIFDQSASTLFGEGNKNHFPERCFCCSAVFSKSVLHCSLL